MFESPWYDLRGWLGITFPLSIYLIILQVNKIREASSTSKVAEERDAREKELISLRQVIVVIILDIVIIVIITVITFMHPISDESIRHLPRREESKMTDVHATHIADDFCPVG